MVRFRRPGLIAFCLAVVGVLIVAGCAGDDGAASTTSTTRDRVTSSTSGSSTTGDPEAARRQAVQDAYQAAARAAIDAGAIPDPDLPSLAATHTGPMLEQRRDVLASLKADGRFIRYPSDSKYRNEFESTDLRSADIAVLMVCTVDDGERVVAATGEVLLSGVSTVLWEVAMRQMDGVWKLAERVERQRWDGEAGCAVD